MIRKRAPVFRHCGRKWFEHGGELEDGSLAIPCRYLLGRRLANWMLSVGQNKITLDDIILQNTPASADADQLCSYGEMWITMENLPKWQSVDSVG